MIGGDENYSHWLFRNTLKMCSLDRAGLLFSLPWLVNSDLQPYQLEYMQLLGQTPERLLKVERHTVVRCARVLVPALLVSKQAVRQGVQWLRKKVAHLCVPQAQATPEALKAQLASEVRRWEPVLKAAGVKGN